MCTCIEYLETYVLKHAEHILTITISKKLTVIPGK